MQLRIVAQGRIPPEKIAFETSMPNNSFFSFRERNNKVWNIVRVEEFYFSAVKCRWIIDEAMSKGCPANSSSAWHAWRDFDDLDFTIAVKHLIVVRVQTFSSRLEHAASFYYTEQNWEKGIYLSLIWAVRYLGDIRWFSWGPRYRDSWVRSINLSPSFLQIWTARADPN